MQHLSLILFDMLFVDICETTFSDSILFTRDIVKKKSKAIPLTGLGGL
jgi:hypothetical protein